MPVSVGWGLAQPARGSWQLPQLIVLSAVDARAPIQPGEGAAGLDDDRGDSGHIPDRQFRLGG